MTKETKIFKSTKFMALENSVNEWAESIINDLQKFKRMNTKEEISKNNFNSKEKVKS